jgi:hypothetical protein
VRPSEALVARRRPPKPWVHATLALVIIHATVLAVLQARPGLVAVVLWYTERPLVAIAAAALLGSALIRLQRRRETARPGLLIAYLALAALVGSLAVFRTYPSSHDHHPSEVRFQLPLDGPVTVAWGGPTLTVNYHATLPDQRWAYDLLIANEGRTFRSDGRRLDDYYAYGRPVLAPASGVVRAIHDGLPDGVVGQWSLLRGPGNHVVLEVAEDEFLFIAHLQPGSIAVAPGDRVSTGMLIGRAGNSGNSSEPHVHLHLQDTAAPYLAEGIPFYFHRYRTGGALIERGMPYGGWQRRTGQQPGTFTGQVVENVGHD